MRGWIRGVEGERAVISSQTALSSTGNCFATRHGPIALSSCGLRQSSGRWGGAGWKSCVSAVGPLRTINHSLLDGQREEGGRRNSLDSICPHLCYNGPINGGGSMSVFAVVPVLFSYTPVLCTMEGWRALSLFSEEADGRFMLP